jgi:hypothetical protein
MNWHSLINAAIFLGKAALVVGLFGVLIFGYASQTQDRVARYKKTGRVWDLLKIFSRYWKTICALPCCTLGDHTTG